jgi:transposase
MRAIKVSPKSDEQFSSLCQLYRRTRDVRVRTRTQMVLLAVEQGMTAPKIAEIVRENEGTVRAWLRRYEAEGLEGLWDRPRPGGPSKLTPAFVEQMLSAVRKRPRSLALPFSLWSCQRLADYLAEKTGIRVSDETIRRHLAENGITLSRPQHKVSSPDPEYEVKKRRLKRQGAT